MKWIVLGILAAAAVLGASTEVSSAKTYAHFGDRLLATTGGLFGSPCDSGERDRDGMIEYLPTEQCYRMASAERMRGVWTLGLEESRFYPGLTAAPARRSVEQDLLDVWTHDIRPLSGGRTVPGARVVLVDFIGQRTLHAGPHGHWGRWEHLIVMQRLISERELRGPEGVGY